MKIKMYESVDEYLGGFSGETRNKLDQIRTLAKEVAPDATEKISYGIPTLTWHGNLLHFAGYNTHIGLYPGSGPIAQFKEQLTGYKTAKGTIQFPLDKPLPLDLIREITEVCVERNKSKLKK